MMLSVVSVGRMTFQTGMVVAITNRHRLVPDPQSILNRRGDGGLTRGESEDCGDG